MGHVRHTFIFITNHAGPGHRLSFLYQVEPGLDLDFHFYNWLDKIRAGPGWAQTLNFQPVYSSTWWIVYNDEPNAVITDPAIALFFR